MPQDEHPPPAPSSLAGRSGSATSSPMVPPPPPPPPPPQFELEQAELPNRQSKRKDFREILALFHDTKMEPQDKARAWDALWHATLAEAQEETKQQAERKAGKSAHADDVTPVRSGSMTSRHGPGSGPEPPKRPRQTSAADLEPNKVGRLSRVHQSRPKGGGSKLMQKLGGGR